MVRTIGSGAGTHSTALPTITSVYTSIKEVEKCGKQQPTEVLGIRNAELMHTRVQLSQGGFFFASRGMDVLTMEVVFCEDAYCNNC
jgi:hypothetical protein